MSNYRKALLFTAIPIVVLSLVSLGSKHAEVNRGLGISWLIAGTIWLIALLAVVGFRLKKRKEIASGILAGAGIGFASLALTIIIFIALHQQGQ